MKFQAPRGTQDVLPDRVEGWQALEDRARAISTRHGYKEIRTPLFEATELFLRGVGETTDIVTKEMYTFADRKGRSLTLRPENTAGVMRALVEHGLVQPGRIHRLWYVGPMFRYDRPQAGRYRQFYQWGAECVGTASPNADVEIILLLVDYLASFGLADTEVLLNSVGHPGCRPAYQEKLRAYLKPHLDTMCPDCKVRFEKNPLRVLDCKIPHDRAIAEGIPSILDSLCAECRAHFDAVQQGLAELGVKFTLDPRLVRGLDYYTRTAFEVHDQNRSAQSALGGGGRYDGLIEDVGGPSTPGVGFSAGIERILSALETQGRVPKSASRLLYLARVGGADVERAALALARSLRTEHEVSYDYESGKGLKHQLERADKLSARFALILGEDELAAGEVTVKDLTSGTQERVRTSELSARLGARLATPLAPEAAR
ncbi:MAG: histidine--tRNA ligase [Candidatus Eiseniibacteriota bacterium]